MKQKVLIVDDEDLICQMLSKVLTKKGFDVVSASSGPQALLFLALFNIDHVVTDFNMPNMNGADLTRKIRELLPEDTTIIGISASHHNKEKFFEAGANAFLLKPFTLADLFACINEVVSKKLSIA